MVDYSKMPKDLGQLYSFHKIAREGGDDEFATAIEKRINMLKDSGYKLNDEGQTVSRNPIEDDSALTKFRVGMGRGFMDLGQGAKQKALMAGEALGLVDEGRADEYTQGVVQEQQRFEQDYPGIGAESAGRFAGWATPALLTGGAGGVGAAAATGAVEGGMAVTPEASWEDTILQAMVGGGLGAVGAGAPRLIGALRGKAGKGAAEQIDPDMAAAVRETGIELTPDQYNQNLMNRVAGKVMPQRSTKMKQAEEALEGLHAGWKSTDPSLQQKFNAGKQRLMQADSDAFEAMWDAKVSSNQMVPIGDYRVSMQRFGDRLDKSAREFEKAGLGGKDAESMRSILEQMPTPANGKFLTLRELHQFRQRVYQADGFSPDAKKAAYRAISDEMRDTAKINGGDAAMEMMEDRIKKSQGVYNTLESAGIPNKYSPRSAKSDPQKTGDKPFVNALFSKDAGRKDALREVISQTDGGLQRVRSELMDHVMEEADNMTPSQIATRLKKITTAAEGVLPDDEVAILRGLRKIMQTIPREADTAEKIARGGAALAGPVAAGIANPVAGLATAGGLGIIRGAMNKRNVQQALQKAGQLDDDEAIRKIANYIYGETLAGAAVGAGQEIH